MSSKDETFMRDVMNASRRQEGNNLYGELGEVIHYSPRPHELER